MRALHASLIIASIVTTTRIAVADPAPPPGAKPGPKPAAVSPDASAQAAADHKAQMRAFRDEREKKVRDRGEVFARIAVKHDYTGEYVVFRDKDVTAFLDLKDPHHPRYKPEHDEEKEAGQAHVLVVPNEPRETIGKTISSDITADDLETTLKVMREAATIATRLGFKSPRIFVKSPERVGVGYLHVHIVGERDPKVPYPAPLK